MSQQSHDSSGAAPGPLDQFDHEDCAQPAGPAQAATSVLEFDREPPAIPARARPAPLSRLEARARRQRHRRLSYFRHLVANAVAVRERLGRACTAIKDTVLRGSGALSRTVARVAPRAQRAATTASRRALLRASSLVTARAWPPHAAMPAAPIATALEYQEWNRLAAAMLLAIAVAGYGGFVTSSWRGPAEPAAPPAPTRVTARSSGITAPPAEVSAPALEPDPAIRTPEPLPSPAVAFVAVRPATFTPSPSTVTAMWTRRDTRSLERAFTSLRRQTLAFHRCGMRMTASDRAVARCEGVATAAATQASRRATWTINFRRTAGRWVIASVAMR